MVCDKLHITGYQNKTQSNQKGHKGSLRKAVFNKLLISKGISQQKLGTLFALVELAPVSLPVMPLDRACFQPSVVAMKGAGVKMKMRMAINLKMKMAT